MTRGWFRTATRKLAGWLTLAAVLVAMMVTVSFWSFRQIEETAQARQRNNAVLARAYELLAALVDAETSERGFLLTGEESFLEPYLRVHDQVRGEFAQLRHDGGPAQHRLDVVAPLIEAKIPVLALSANAMPRDVERGLAAGFFRYITKPIKVTDFIQSLTLALEEPRTGLATAPEMPSSHRPV